MRLLKPSLSHVPSLDTKCEWSILVPSFGMRSLSKDITIISHFCMRQNFMALIRMSV